jgi:BirA family biotin operon repressor/biotin-[acetyl-CoA-carboxylase] ligase
LPKITNLIGFSFVELPTVDSTNNYAMALVHEGLATHGTAVFAHEQTAGKGQRGKQWSSDPGSNIMLSVLVNPSPIAHLPPFALSVATALACHDLFTRYALYDTFIKWPNDIYWRDRKAGGILIENVYRGKEWQWAILGIGLNINQTQFPEEIRRPVSLMQITGRAFDSVALARELCACLEERWQELRERNEGVMLRAYEDLLLGRDKPIRLRRGSVVFETEILGVLADGRLRTSEGGETFFSAGDVEWVW